MHNSLYWRLTGVRDLQTKESSPGISLSSPSVIQGHISTLSMCALLGKHIFSNRSRSTAWLRANSPQSPDSWFLKPDDVQTGVTRVCLCAVKTRTPKTNKVQMKRLWSVEAFFLILTSCDGKNGTSYHFVVNLSSKCLTIVFLFLVSAHFQTVPRLGRQCLEAPAVHPTTLLVARTFFKAKRWYPDSELALGSSGATRATGNIATLLCRSGSRHEHWANSSGNIPYI